MALDAREKDLEGQITTIKELKETLKGQADAFYEDPVAALKALGITAGLGDLAHVLMAAELGEDADPEYSDRLQGRKLETRLEKQQRDLDDKIDTLEENQRQAKFNEWQTKYVDGFDSFCKAADEKEMPYLASWYAEEPDEVLEMMYGHAVEIARENPQSATPQADFLARELNQKLESKLGPILSRLIDLELAAEDPNPAEEANKADPTKTLRNTHAARTNPKAPAATDEERTERALAALMANT